MAEDVRLLVTDPDARVLDADTGTWIVSGIRAGALESVVREATNIEAVRDEVVSIAEDAAIVHVSGDGRTVHAYRTVTGTHRLYYLRASNGEAVVTDHFRNALAQLDVADRHVPDRAIVDHLLFRAPIPPTSFVEGIETVGQGEWLEWDVVEDTRTSTLVDRVTPDGTIQPGAAPAELDTRLTDLFAHADADAVNLYSGGVDSTLTQTYLDDATMLNVAVNSPEYEFESEYAREGAALFDATLEQEMLDEADVLASLESSVDAIASPGYPFLSLMMNAAFSEYEGRQYVIGVGADSLYGNTATKGVRIASWLSPFLQSSLSKPVRRLAPGKASSFLGWLETLADQQSRPPEHPDSFPQQFAAYTNPPLVGGMLSDSLVEDRCREMVEYVRRRVELTDATDRFARQIELGHLLQRYSHRVGSRWRQFAYANGNSLLVPFETRSMLAESLGVPASKRYVGGLGELPPVRTKHLLKDLLAERLPSYPLDQKKGSGILPFDRYFADGPLANVFEKYPIPEFVPEGMRERAIENSGRQAWNVVTYAVWRDRALRNADLSVVPGTTELAWTPTERRAPTGAVREGRTD